MKFRRPATKVQKIMAVLMVVAFLSLLIWVIPEMMGILSPGAEDTWSEFVWDQPLGVVIVISLIHGIAALLLAGSAWHFLEGYARRRRAEKRVKELREVDL